jgi:hypothetical protein
MMKRKNIYGRKLTNKIKITMKTKNILLAILGAALSTACSSTVDCPGFPENLVDYFPYQVGDTLRFVNENSDTLAFGVSEAWYVKPKTTKDEGGLFADCDCAMCAPLQSNFKSFHNDYGRIEGGLYFIGGGLVRIQVVFDGNRLYDDDDVFTKDAENAAFGDTVVWNKTDARRVNYVVVVKGLGITEFYDVITNDLWKSIVK